MQSFFPLSTFDLLLGMGLAVVIGTALSSVLDWFEETFLWKD